MPIREVQFRPVGNRVGDTEAWRDHVFDRRFNRIFDDRESNFISLFVQFDCAVVVEFQWVPMGPPVRLHRDYTCHIVSRR